MNVTIPMTCADAISRTSRTNGSRVVDVPVAVALPWNHASTFGGVQQRKLGGGVLRGGDPGS